MHLLSFFSSYFVLAHLVCLPIDLAQADQTIESLLKCVIVADDDELIEATYTANLLGQVDTTQFIHVLGGLVKEGNVEVRELLEQGQAHGECRAHLLATAQLGEAAIDRLATQDDL